jgi:hypothetical protein
MKVATGKVVAGKVVVEGEPLPEGSTVTVLSSESEESFEATPEQEAELLAAIAEADRGDSIPAGELLQDLRSER